MVDFLVCDEPGCEITHVTAGPLMDQGPLSFRRTKGCARQPDQFDTGSGAGQLSDSGVLLGRVQSICARPLKLYPSAEQTRVQPSMSVAGLRYGADASTARGPSETRSGAPIFHGDPASYHDWEFRVSLRLELLEAQEQALRLAVQAELEDDAESGPGLATGVEDEDGKDFPPTEPSRTLSTPPRTKKKSYDPEKDIAKERTLLVSRIMEGLRGDAFLVARDLGVAALIADNGIRTLIQKLKESVFPRATEEARELFRLGQLRGGMLSRQNTGSMVSFVDRRRRWWRMISEMDATTQPSELMRCELMIEMSGITQQEALVVKAIAGTPLNFEKVGKTLIEHYGSVHLKGGRSLTSTASAPPKGIPKGKGKGKPTWRSGYFVDAPETNDWYDEDGSYGYDSHYENYAPDEYVGLLGTTDPVMEESQDEYEKLKKLKNGKPHV